MKNISILGSTGSIGTQVLNVVRTLKEFKIVGIACDSNIDLLEKQIREFKPKIAAVFNEEKAKEIKTRIKDTNTKIFSGMEGLVQVVSQQNLDLAVISISGVIGLLPTIEAINNRINIAISTKEILVAAGELIINKAKEYNVSIVPIDSEHCAIMQCLRRRVDNVNKIILTASGGPFLGKTEEFLRGVAVEEALNHPNWDMGKKISIDSATLMNKGLEVIEARWLFNIESDKITVLIHPQSIVHSMVEYIDGSIIAQLSVADMRIPIQYALTYPNRVYNNIGKLDLIGKKLSFEEPDYNTFKALKLAYSALYTGGTMPAVLNSSNEAAVKLFLNNKIKFIDIVEIVEQCMNKHEAIENPDLESIFDADYWARNTAYNLIH